MGPPPGMSPTPSPMKPGAGRDASTPEPNAMKSQIVGMLKQVKKVAEENGLDWNSVMAEVEGASAKASPTVPRMTSPGPGIG